MVGLTSAAGFRLFFVFLLLLFYSIIFPVCTVVVKAGGGTSTGNIYSSTVLLKKNLTKGPCLCDPHSAESARPPSPLLQSLKRQ